MHHLHFKNNECLTKVGIYRIDGFKSSYNLFLDGKFLNLTAYHLCTIENLASQHYNTIIKIHEKLLINSKHFLKEKKIKPIKWKQINNSFFMYVEDNNKVYTISKTCDQIYWHIKCNNTQFLNSRTKFKTSKEAIEFTSNHLKKPFKINFLQK